MRKREGIDVSSLRFTHYVLRLQESCYVGKP